MRPQVPQIGFPEDNRRVLLTTRPTGIPQPEHFTLDRAPRPEPGEGEILVRNLYLSVDPAQRGWAMTEANYSAPVPLGGVMRALAVGQVHTSRHPDFQEGEFLYGWFDWQDWCVATPALVLRRVDPSVVPLSGHAGLLGINGLTAYLALHVLGAPRAGDRVLVSTAAGAVGSIVGQIARNLGCTAIGLTGADDKVALCTSKFGYVAALNYKTADLPGELARLAEGGFQIFFDSVGGAILDAGLRRMAVGGRVIQCGTASVASWTPPPQGPRNEREVLARRLAWRGFVIFDHMAEFEAAAAVLTDWYARGDLTFEEDIEDGLQGAPSAIAKLYAGENRGKTLMYVGAP